MQRINIDNLIDGLDNPFGTKGEKFNSNILKKSFLGSTEKIFKTKIKKGESESDDNKILRNQYNKYTSTAKKYKDFKILFLSKLYNQGFKFCCYCGKDRISHFTDSKGTHKKLYDIEHFLPRSRFPDLSVNPYNWLPVCMSCNQRLKSDNNPLSDGNEIFHPYFGFLKLDTDLKIITEDCNFSEKVSFNTGEVDDISDIKLSFDKIGHSNFFELEKIYLNSQDTFNTFNFIQDKITKIKDEEMNFKNSSKSIDELKDYFFKNYAPKDETEILKFSNGKFKKDLIDNLKLD